MNTIGFIGLGKMGQNMIVHLLEGGINVVAYNRTSTVTEEFANEVESMGSLPATLTTVSSVSDLIKELPTPRVILLMVKAGEPVDALIKELETSGLQTDDILIDGGNSFFEDTKRRYTQLQEKKIHYIDCGTSGGLEGARKGACLMLGGEQSIVESLDELWNALAKDNGTWTYFGASGAGHFVKMVHNGVEYGIDQAIGEGFALLEKSPYDLDLADVANNWNKGSVIRSWLMELIHKAFEKDPKLGVYKGRVGGGETGRWTVETAQKLGVPQPMVTQALQARVDSQTTPTFASKVVSALRFEYGGHKEE